MSPITQFTVTLTFPQWTQRSWTLTHLNVSGPLGRGGLVTCWHPQAHKKILSSKTRACMKAQLMCWFPLFFPVTSSSFHVWMSRCLHVPEMTASLTPWVRRLTARPAAATPERTDALEKTWPRPPTRGSPRPTSQGWCGGLKFTSPVTDEINPFTRIQVMIIALNMRSYETEQICTVMVQEIYYCMWPFKNISSCFFC